MKINEYLDNCKKELKIKADSRLASEIGVTRSVVSLWRAGRQAPDMYSCFQIGEILDIDARIIIANVKHEVERDDFKAEYWEEKVKEYGYFTTNYALFLSKLSAIVYILCKIGYPFCQINFIKNELKNNMFIPPSNS